MIISKNNLLVIAAAIGMMLLFSCGKDHHEERAKIDRRKILEYIEENGIEEYYELESGVFIAPEAEGSGAYPHQFSTVKLNYVGYLLDGDVFDAGYGADMYLPHTILGFRLGIMEFQRGGKGLVLVPSALGYGERGTMSIPRNAVLIFDIEIIDIR